MTKKLGCLFALLMFVSTSVYAGGPLIIFDEFTRTPYAYPAGTVDVYTDLGSNGVLTGPESDSLTAQGYAAWSGVATSYFSAAVAGDFSAVPLPDIDGFNAGLVVGVFNGGGIHVMYDNDASIVFNYFGAPPGVLGIGSPDFATTGTPDLLESWTVLNGTTADPGDPAGQSFGGVFTHEFGHTINLAHTQTNGAAGFFGDGLGPDFCAKPYGGPLTLSDFETMYPFLDPSPGSTGVYQATVDILDDVAALSDIYPTAGWPNTHGTITGKVLAPDGVTEVTGINVIVRNVADPYKDASSALSGDYTQGALGPDGLFTLNGLTPGAEYVVYIDEIVNGGYSTSPGSIPGDGDEEYWNNAESSDPSVDDPCDWTVIITTAGAPVTADVIANGDPFNLDLGDDDYVEVALPFTFPFCGLSYNSVFVNSNGSVSFGAGDTDFSESVDEFLEGPPRIALMWDDLNPSAGGSITAMPVGADFVVQFSNVPEYFATGGNSFKLTMRADGSYDVDYGTITAFDGIAGRTEDMGADDPGETDLTAEPQPIGAGVFMSTVYELFLGDNDLDGEFMAWAPCEIPDPQAIAVDPNSLDACLLAGDMITQTLTITNLGDLDLTFNILSDQLFAVASSDATGGVISRYEPQAPGDMPTADEARLGRMIEDRQGSRPDKPDVSPLRVPLPHTYALSLLTEDFNSGFPAGWSVVDNVALGVSWMVPAQDGGNHTGGTGDAAGACSDCVGPADFDTELRTPPITGFGPNVVVTYLANYQNFANFDFLDLDVSVDGGTNWSTVLSWNEDHGSFFGSPGEMVSLNLDAFVAGYPEFILRWRYYDPTTFDFDWYAQIDDVMIVSDELLTPCSFLTVAPTSGTIGQDGSQNVDVTFDATGFEPGVYDCELIIFSNAVNEPRLVVPLEMTVAQEVAFDIKPGSCPNPLNVKKTSRGNNLSVFPMALLGTADFDIGDIDVSSLLLNGLAPIRSSVSDVATPFAWDDCECGTAGSDGYDDLTLKFIRSDIIATLGMVANGEVIELRISGTLLDGTKIIGRDCVKINGSPREMRLMPGVVLGEPVPNPFNPVTRISYSVPDESFVKLSVYDVRGRLITHLVSGTRSPGEHTVQWDASGAASGIYFYRLEVGNFIQTRKMILLK